MFQRILTVMVVASLPVAAAAEQVRLLPPASDDFQGSVRTTQMAQVSERPEGPRGEAASIFMPASDGKIHSGGLQAPEGESRSYRLEVSAARLADGVSLPLSAAGAVVRLSPVGSSGARQLQGRDVEIRQGPWALQGRAVARELAGAEHQQAAREVFGPDTLAFRLDRRIAAGEATLQVRREALMRGGRYQVHVFEPESPAVGVISASQPLVSLGESLSAEAGVAGLRNLKVESVEAWLHSPSGERMRVDDLSTVTLPRLSAVEPGLWELEGRIQARGPDGPVRRDVRVAFEGVPPTARLDGRIALERERGEWRLRLGVEVGTAGRYELRASLPGAGTAHAARWLEPGAHELVLSFPGEPPRDAVLRDLRLVDQSRMAMLHVQDQGIQIGGWTPILPGMPLR
ncbi:DUF4785 domain-containing protein [Natronospira sp.]|uniref:DUF4785 domain-containing protein n=1 Tax=Natronospira sp. TaxID=2024970 RepID=UPI00387344EE